jgi:SAM-dependent methyltransferase
VIVLPAASPQQSEWTDFLEDGATHASGLWRRHADRVNGALIARWLPRNLPGRVLKTDLYDEAMGDGLCSQLAQPGSEVVGIDVSTPVVESARRRHPRLTVLTADVRRLPFASGTFDAILSNSTLDHFPSEGDLAAALGELARVLRPGGRLVVTLDNPSNPVIALRGLLPQSCLRRGGLIPYYMGATVSQRRLRALLSRLGLDVLNETAILHCPRIFAIPVSRWFSRRGDAMQRRFLHALERFETLGRCGSRYWTGHFVAAMAAKPGGPGALTTGRMGR